MAALQAEKVRATTVTPDGFDVGYITEDGVEFRTPLTEAWTVPFEQGKPVRRFTSRKGQWGVRSAVT